MSTIDHKQAVYEFSRAQSTPDWAAFESSSRALLADDVICNIIHPFNTIHGSHGYLSNFLSKLFESFSGLHRRDDILIGGEFEGSSWVSTHGNYVGHFSRDWLGIKATGRLEYLRYGEFFRFEGESVVELTIYLDIPQLMIAANTWPIQDSPGLHRGYTGFLPGPATCDGIQLGQSDDGRSLSSLKMVEDMLASLATKDEAWRPYWHDNMMWYGPAAFGSFIGIEEFAGFQVPFEDAFSLWSGGSTNNGVTKHFCRFADGNYVCSGGWPSLMCIRKEEFLGQPATDQTLLMRVCDWWRRDGESLRENWVFVDIPDVLLQMGVDLFEGFHDVALGPRLAK